MDKSKKPIPDALKSVNSASSDGYVIPDIGPKLATKATYLTGNTVRRATSGHDEVLWDTELTGFGLRVRATGSKSWIVRFRRRGKQQNVTLGKAGDLSATEARAQARAMLKEAATDGLPGRARI